MTTASHNLKLIDENGHSVVGEAEARGFARTIDITDWNWDVKDPTTQRSATSTTATKGAAAKASKASGGGETDTRIQPSLFSFDKYVDRSTTRLMTALYRGEKFKRAIFTLREELVGVKIGPHGQFKLVVTLEGDVVLTKCTISLKTNEFGVDLEENWELRYTTITFEMGGDGTPDYHMASFDLPPDADAEASKRPPPTAAEAARKAAEDAIQRMDPRKRAELLAAMASKKGR